MVSVYYQNLLIRSSLNELKNNEFFGDLVSQKLTYYPTVTREKYENNGRLTDLMISGKLFLDLGMPHLMLKMIDLWCVVDPVC